MSEEVQAVIDYGRVGKRRKIFGWFFVGFTIAFVGLAIFHQADYFTGLAIYRIPLWRFYILEFRAAQSTYVGYNDGSPAIPVAIGHFLCSALAGGLTLGVAWLWRRRSNAP